MYVYMYEHYYTAETYTILYIPPTIPYITAYYTLYNEH